MQTPKTSKKSSAESPQKISPRAVRQLKTTTVETSRACSSTNVASKTPKDRSPKVIERKSPKSPALEKKRPSKISELESRISQLEEELTNTKEQVTSSELSKINAEKNEEDLKEQVQTLTKELKESKTHVTELEKISGDRDVALQRAESTEAELKSLKVNMGETLSLVEEMKRELIDCRESEAQAQAMVGETLLQLESAKKTVEALQLEGVNNEKACKSMAFELDQTRANVELLEGQVRKLEADNVNANNEVEYKNVENGEIQKIAELEAELISVKNELDQSRANVKFLEGNVKKLEADNEGANYEVGYKNIEDGKIKKIAELEAELSSVKNELGLLKTALEFAEIKYTEENIQSILLINSANEMAEQIKSSSSVREAELEAELNKIKADAEELKANLLDKEKMEVKKLQEEIEILKGNLMDKETESQNISEENEMLKLEMKRIETENGNRELEVLEKLRCTSEESNKRVNRVSEQLEVVQAANTEMERELRKLKVQSDQWRKAAEVAAAMVGSNGKFVERTGSLDSSYNSMGKVNSPYAEDVVDDDLMKKKNGNVLKKIGVLWKKPQK